MSIKDSTIVMLDDLQWCSMKYTKALHNSVTF